MNQQLKLALAAVLLSLAGWAQAQLADAPEYDGGDPVPPAGLAVALECPDTEAKMVSIVAEPAIVATSEQAVAVALNWLGGKAVVVTVNGRNASIGPPYILDEHSPSASIVMLSGTTVVARTLEAGEHLDQESPPATGEQP